jgi:protease IV
MLKLFTRPRRELLTSGLTVGVIALGVMILAGAIIGSMVDVESDEDGVGLVEVFDAIYDSRSVVRQLKHFAESETVPVIVLRLNSPGGAVGASQEIYRQVQITREAGKKVIASMGNVAASGAYYIAAAADTIMSNPGTVTGSIGVIAEFLQADTLFRKIGISFNIIKRGEFKATGAPDRAPSARQLEMIQRLIDDAYEQFVDDIHDSRGVSYESLDTLAQGQVFTGRQAVTYGLVDTLGNLDDAMGLARQMGGLEKDAPIIRAPMPKKSFLEQLSAKASGLWGGSSMRISYLMR